MPTVDTTTVLGGYGQLITDWILGDDRDFSGDIQSSVNPPPSGDANLASAYFTLKQSPTDTDANAIIQTKITQIVSVNGQIIAGAGGFFSNLNLKIIGGNYESLVNAGTVYYWDFRCITLVGGVTLTVANGTVAFIQEITQTNAAGTPATYPNSGQPQIRGFVYTNPQNISNLNTFFNVGDIYFNSVPGLLGPVGWQCIGSGTPGSWVSFGVGLGGNFTPAFNWAFGTAAPTGGSHVQNEIVWNTNCQVGGNIGWVCVIAGTPGTWYEFGPIATL